jgi:branched-chain amino acid transport system substrate-binding protein
VRRALVVATSIVLAAGVACTSSDDAPATVRLGAVYPLSGAQGPGGRDEFRGVQLAVDTVNAEGGVNGEHVELRAIDVESGEQAPAAIDQLAGEGIDIVLGTYGTTISEPAANQAASHGMLFWETGAVGSMPAPDAGGSSFFRVAPSGDVLGRDAVSFIAKELVPKLGHDPSTLRFGVVSVDDAYGEAVGDGAIEEIRAEGLPYSGRSTYDPNRFDPTALVRQIARTEPDVLFVAAYLEDGIALRRAMVREHLPLVANIGTSSSYCMPAFGKRLGADAVGLFASDKLDGEYVDPKGLTPSGRSLLREARETYEDTYDAEMSAAALAGFSAAWALLHDVLPAAADDSPAAIASAALATHLPVGSLPSGSGLAFGEPGTPRAGLNLRATSVIWEWVADGEREVVWPPRFATTPVEPIRIAT